jgi:hypothetical protein
MGRMNAIAISDEALGIDLETQLEWHLRSNHYPPVPVSMVPVCIEAIDLANEGDWDAVVTMPEGVSYRGSSVAPVYAIVEQHHLDNWIIESELY